MVIGKTNHGRVGRWMVVAALMFGGAPAAAQESPLGPRERPVQQGDSADQLSENRPPLVDPSNPRPRRFRVTLGPQFQPRFPGDDKMRLQPMIIINRARGDDPFPFGAPGDGNALTLLRAGPAEFGPLFRLEGRRRADHLGGGLPTIGRTVELGGFGQLWLGESIRLRGDIRRGVGGHEGWISQLGGDYVARDRDRWIVSLGPRLFLSDGRYQREWFGVTPATTATTGLPTFRPGGGAHGVGATSRAIFALNDRWGVTGQVVYARLIDDAGRSPIIRRADSRNQLTVGLGLNYTFTVR